jgi:predicted MFS family arabinose efflux permease
MFIHSIRAISATRPTRAVALLFLCNGFALANWFSRIPAMKEALALSDGVLGLALLGMPLGSMLVLPFSGRLVGRAGAGRLAFASGVALTAAITLPGLGRDVWTLFAALFLLGMANATMDVAMNAKAATVESAAGVHLMSAFHGMWSVGFFLGAATGGLFAEIGVVPSLHLLVVAVVLLGLLLTQRRVLRDKPARVSASDPVLALPRGALWPLALIATASMLAEGAVADWSAVYLRESLGSSPGIAALALSAFSLGLTATRFAADRLGERFGDLVLLRVGALIAALGMASGIVSQTAPVAILGFLAVGVGFAAVVPIAFRRAANTPGVTPGVGVAAVATLAYTGFLAGPPLIGLIAEGVGLGMAMAIIPLLALVIVAISLTVASDRRVDGHD